jgi:hypothetical protein
VEEGRAVNRLNPDLKELMIRAHEVDETSFPEPEPSPAFIRRVLSESRISTCTRQYGLVEMMVQRGAILAAIAGVITVCAKVLSGSASATILNYFAGHGGTAVRTFLP